MTDPSGMCPLPGELGSYDCQAIAQGMQWWGVRVVWDYPASNPNTCLDPVVQSCLDQNTRQRWTLNEMLAVYNAVRIFRTAQSNIGFAPLNGDIFIEKRYEAGGTVAQQMALGLTVGHTITLSARWWGEGQRTGTYNADGKDITVESIDFYGDITDSRQYRAWIVLHEMGHVLTTGLGVNLEALYNSLPPAFKQNFFPTKYSFTGGRIEYMVEAVAGTLWNNGYQVISGFDPSAGGRTGWLDNRDRVTFPGSINNNRFTGVIVNVADSIWLDAGADQTLQEWITQNVLLA